MTGPTFAHDCASCTFQGRLASVLGHEPMDVYTCPNSHGPLLRFGNESCEYMSLYVRDDLDVSIRFEDGDETCSGLNGTALLAFGIQEYLRRKGVSTIPGRPELDRTLRSRRLKVLEEAYDLVENALGTDAAEQSLGKEMLHAMNECDSND